MKKFYSGLATALMLVGSLASCSRSTYVFQPTTSAYHGTVVRTEAVSKQQTVAVESTLAAESASPTAPTKASEVIATPNTALAASGLSDRAKVAKKVKPATVAKLAVLPKVLNKLERVASKELQKKQNTASVNEPAASKAGRAAIVAGVGLLLLLLGGAAEIGIIAIIGLLAFIVGVIMLIIALINGND